MAKMRDITGQRFGKLVALYPTNKRQNSHVVWHCKCDCGVEKDIRGGDLTSGKTKSCGCWSKQQKTKDLTGKRFGKLVVLHPTEERKNGSVVWRCKCDCGNTVDVTSRNLTSSGHTKSCGCSKQRDITNQRFGKLIALYPTNKRQSGGNVVWHCKCDCGNTVDVSSGELTRKTRNGTKSCGCITSRGEEKIVEILNELGIKYEKEKKFKDCTNPKTGYPLRFDFFLPDYDCCIEYDGEQHSEAVDYFGGEDTLTDVQYRDNIKDNFCKENNIKLIRIPYTEYNKINNDFIWNCLNT